MGKGRLFGGKQLRLPLPAQRRRKGSRIRSASLVGVACAAAAFYVGYGSDFRVDHGWFDGSTLTSGHKAAAATLQGRATIIDGDTIEISGQRVRFNGVDAPESAQLCQSASGKDYRCGVKSAAALDDYLAQSRPVRCDFVEWDQYQRFVGNCFRADGLSVAAWMVENGHALDWPRYSNGAYAKQQSKARAEKAGIWSGTFQEPWAWRAEHRSDDLSETKQPAQAVGIVSTGCKIKGNISTKGERIYHVPGQEHYGETVITTTKGERWFCTELDARGAGWRKAKR